MNGVGPVLQAGPLTEAVLAAIRDGSGPVEIVDRGGYLRVLAPGRCVVRREAIERRTGAPFVLPSDLESIMTSYRGRFRVNEDEASWEEP